MEKQEHNVSKFMWSEEKECLITVLGTTPDRLDIIKELIKVVDPKIEDYSLTYDEFVNDLAEEFKKILSEESSETEENRSYNINKLISNLTEKYK